MTNKLPLSRGGTSGSAVDCMYAHSVATNLSFSFLIMDRDSGCANRMCSETRLFLSLDARPNKKRCWAIMRAQPNDATNGRKSARYQHKRQKGSGSSGQSVSHRISGTLAVSSTLPPGCPKGLPPFNVSSSQLLPPATRLSHEWSLALADSSPLVRNSAS